MSLFPRVQHEPALGRYDLRIRNASYERDNGDFECRKVEFGTGTKLHSSMIQLVVLLKPSQPVVSPTLPTVTEGKAFNLSCSSVGGSPPPEILWYKDGSEDGEEGSVFTPGRTRTEASSAVLTVVPRKEVSQPYYGVIIIISTTLRMTTLRTGALCGTEPLPATASWRPRLASTWTVSSCDGGDFPALAP